VFLQYFDSVGWVLWPVKNRRPYNLYCVGGDVKHCSIQSNPILSDQKTLGEYRPLKRLLCLLLWSVYMLL